LQIVDFQLVSSKKYLISLSQNWDFAISFLSQQRQFIDFLTCATHSIRGRQTLVAACSI